LAILALNVATDSICLGNELVLIADDIPAAATNRRRHRHQYNRIKALLPLKIGNSAVLTIDD
jgi:hypothetical protein